MKIKKIFSKYKEFVNLINFIDSLLTTEQKQILEFKYKEIVIDFKTQLLLYFEEKYDSGFSLEELKEKAAKVLKKYSFLFETNWDYSQIRTILLRELMEVISIGSQCFHYRRIGIFRNKPDPLTGWSASSQINFMREFVKQKYPNLPSRMEKIYKKEFNFDFSQEFFWRGYNFTFDEKDSKEKWKSEFFKKTKWFFEQLNFCEEEYRNKYREKIYKETCSAIGVGTNCSHIYITLKRILSKHKSLSPWKHIHINIDRSTNKHLQEIIEEIINYFEEKELNTLSKIDSQGKQWSFKEQLLDRYYSKYTSLVSLEEIKTQIRKIVLKYKPFLLLEQKTEIIKELLFEDLEKELFISKSLQDWNKEMIGNLCTFKNKKINYRTKWAIDQTIKFIGSENIKKLSLKIEEKEYDLKTLLIARWGSSLLARGKNYFKTRLLLAFIKNDLNKGITRTNFQAILEELDSCFLKPTPNRIKRILLRKDGTEDISKLRKNIWTVYIELLKIKSFVNVLFLLWISFFIFLVWKLKIPF